MVSELFSGGGGYGLVLRSGSVPVSSWPSLHIAYGSRLSSLSAVWSFSSALPTSEECNAEKSYALAFLALFLFSFYSGR